MSTHDHIETEWQFESAAPPQRWLRRAELPAGYALGAPQAEVIADTYYDTDDWRLYRAGYALRVRQTRTDAGLEGAKPAFYRVAELYF